MQDDSKFHYIFDVFQRIVEVKDQSQNLVAKYQTPMDTSNRRISKTVGTTVHRTVYAAWQVAEEYEAGPSGKKFKTTTKVYVYGQCIEMPYLVFDDGMPIKLFFENDFYFYEGNSSSLLSYIYFNSKLKIEKYPTEFLCDLSMKSAIAKDILTACGSLLKKYYLYVYHTEKCSEDDLKNIS